MINCQSLVLQKFRSALFALLLLIASGSSVSDAPAATPTSEPSTATPTPSSATLPLPYSDPLKLVAIPETSPPRDVQSPFLWPSTGFVPVAFEANKTFAKLGDLDVFEMRDRLYAVQKRNPGGYVLTDVTNPAEPVYLGTWELNPHAGGEHIEAFRQGDHWYLVLPLEDDWAQGLPCGLAIIEITDPLDPILQGLHKGLTVGAGVNWCDVHSVDIINDENRNAEYMLAAASDTFDLRVLDISNLNNIQEINVYHHHVHPHGIGGTARIKHVSYAHMVTTIDNRVYVSHWEGGVMILDKTALLSGRDAKDVELTTPGSIAATNFAAHDAYPTNDGKFLFVNDAFISEGGIRLFDIRDPARAQIVQTLNFEGLRSKRHTLLVQDDLLFVPWFQEGVRVFRYDVSQADKPVLEPVAFQEVREQPHNIYDGVFRLRLHDCQVDGEMRTCVFASDMTLGLIILALDDV
jgi:hypothetical protein